MGKIYNCLPHEILIGIIDRTCVDSIQQIKENVFLLIRSPSLEASPSDVRQVHGDAHDRLIEHHLDLHSQPFDIL